MKRYTKEAAEAAAEAVTALFQGEASYKLYERDERYGRGYIFIAVCGAVSVKSTQPGRYIARYTMRQRGISSECLDFDAETAEMALYKMRHELHERQLHMQRAKECVK